MYRGYPFQGGDKLGARDMNELLEAVDRSFNVRTLDPRAATTNLPYGTVTQRLTFPNEITSRQTTSQTFLGQIWRLGPDGEDDYEDSRYWVREIKALAADDATHRDRPELKADFDPPLDGLRWLTATNVAEYDPTTFDPDEVMESHSLGLVEVDEINAGALVHVFAVYAGDGVAHFWFNRPAVRSAVEFGVIRDLGEDPQGTTLQVETVQIPDEPVFEGVLEGTGSVEPAKTWPHTQARHYAGLEWMGDLTLETNILPIVFNKGAWWVLPHFRMMPKRIPPETRRGGCRVVTEGG